MCLLAQEIFVAYVKTNEAETCRFRPRLFDAKEYILLTDYYFFSSDGVTNLNAYKVNSIIQMT